MTRWKVPLIALASVLCIVGGLLGIVAYVTHEIGQSDRGWCNFISTAQPRSAPERPRPGSYGDRLLHALDQHGHDIGCKGLDGVPNR